MAVRNSSEGAVEGLQSGRLELHMGVMSKHRRSGWTGTEPEEIGGKQQYEEI